MLAELHVYLIYNLHLYLSMLDNQHLYRKNLMELHQLKQLLKIGMFQVLELVLVWVQDLRRFDHYLQILLMLLLVRPK